jgi:hypothetical protein
MTGATAADLGAFFGASNWLLFGDSVSYFSFSTNIPIELVICLLRVRTGVVCQHDGS